MRGCAKKHSPTSLFPPCALQRPYPQERAAAGSVPHLRRVGSEPRLQREPQDMVQAAGGGAGRTRPNQASASCLWDPACSPGRSDRRSEGAGCFRGCCRIPSRGKKRVSLHSSQMLCRSRLPEPRRCGGGAPLAGPWPRVRRRRSGGKPVVRHRVS